MTDQPTQNLANHRRFDPPWHFFAVPILLLNMVATIWHAWGHPSPWDYWLIVVSIGLFVAVGAARGQTLRVQDRVIRLEMRLRLREVLPAPLAVRVMDLNPKQLVGLRFASNSELPGLVERCLSGELTTDADVKKQVRDWQPDRLRA